MNKRKRTEVSLLSLRLGVFVVMAMWTLDKFINTEHAVLVYQHFYFINAGFASSIMYFVAGVEAAVILAFLIGFKKRLSYGAVLAFHTVSTLSSWKQYVAPFEPYHLLFFAAWPMLAACVALYLMRDMDRMWSLNG